MKENDIRPTAVMDGAHAAMLADAGRMLSRRQEFVTVDCPACGSAIHEYRWNKYGFDFVECLGCQTTYINPRPTAEIVADMYANSANYQYWNANVYPASDVARRRQIVVPRVDRVLDVCGRYHSRTELLLEVGCGYGTFIDEMTARERFSFVSGIDPTSNHGQVSRITIEQMALESASASVVCAFEVIEHAFSPFDFVTACSRNLAPGGLLILTCPNIHGFDFVTLGRECGNMDHEHLNYFNPKSLSLLVKRCGFEVLECSTPGKLDAELARSVIMAGHVRSNAFLDQVLIDEWDAVGANFQTFLAENNLSSHLWLVARKPA